VELPGEVVNILSGLVVGALEHLDARQLSVLTDRNEEILHVVHGVVAHVEALGVMYEHAGRQGEVVVILDRDVVDILEAIGGHADHGVIVLTGANQPPLRVLLRAILAGTGADDLLLVISKALEASPLQECCPTPTTQLGFNCRGQIRIDANEVLLTI